ncbi:MAG: hypothetical protein IJU94_03555 [Clostridia bacterium]|nr:hypothetical protein [Clostridia bacterium]
MDLDLVDMIEAIRPRAVMVVKVNGRIFYAHIEDNPSAKALTEKLNSAGVTVDMRDCGFGKVGSLPWELPRNGKRIAARPGDLVLCEDGGLALYYDGADADCTRLARLGKETKEEILAALGEGDVSVTLYLEWSE